MALGLGTGQPIETGAILHGPPGRHRGSLRGSAEAILNSSELLRMDSAQSPQIGSHNARIIARYIVVEPWAIEPAEVLRQPLNLLRKKRDARRGQR